MDGQIPLIIEDLYRYFVTEPNPKFWPDHMSDDPVKAHRPWAAGTPVSSPRQARSGRPTP